MAKNFVVFGATGAQGGSVTLALLKASNSNSSINKYNILAVTRNPHTPQAQKLSSAGATLVQADMEDLNSLKELVKGAHFIFVVTDFLGAEGNSDRELTQGLNVIEAASSAACLETLEAVIWSSLPDARKQPFAYENIVHFNSKRAISDALWDSPLRSCVTEVWLAAYYENFVNSWGIYEPQKQPDGSYVLKYPINADSKIPFMSVTDLGKLITVIIEDPTKYHTKVVSFVSEWHTPLELLESFRNGTYIHTSPILSNLLC
ncbi:NmrA-like family domain-containing protein [Lachnellula occidentalis]|uniref:NmrA-like family domain-containing protein n=1 Tax=Lachnellula occidentalis TaxID=215460 RepID=A0A8H8U5Z3_9HELO|nr:NmrA-like family domain-containing protein [Lachnellula occidentalis]